MMLICAEDEDRKLKKTLLEISARYEHDYNYIIMFLATRLDKFTSTRSIFWPRNCI